VLPDVDLAAALGASPGVNAEAPAQRDEVAALLCKLLAHAPVPVLQRHARDVAIARRTIKRALQARGMISAKAGFTTGSGWTWHLPDQRAQLLEGGADAGKGYDGQPA
jgi:hypothetical protein